MIAIARGLLSNLETATATVAKKEGESSGFAAAFEEVSAKDAGAAAQGRRVVGGGGNRGQAVIVGGRNPRSTALGAKAAGNGPTTGTSKAIKGAVEAGLAAKATSSSRAGAASPASATKVDADDLVEGQSAGQDEVMGSEVHEGGPFTSDEAFVRSVPESLKRAASTSEESLPIALAKTSLAGALPLSGVSFSQMQTPGRADNVPALEQAVDLSATVKGASTKMIAGGVPDVAPLNTENPMYDGLQGIGARFEDKVVADGAEAKKKGALVAPGAAGTPGPIVRTSTASRTMTSTRTDGAAGGTSASAAKPGMQTVSGTRHARPLEVAASPVLSSESQEATGAIVPKVAAATPVVGAERVSVQPITNTSMQVDEVGNPDAATQNVLIVAQPKSGSQEIMPQQLSAQAAVAELTSAHQGEIQKTSMQTIAPERKGANGTVTQDAVSIADAIGGTSAGGEQIIPLQPAKEASGGQQMGAQQVQSTQPATQQVHTPLAPTLPVGAVQIDSSDDGTAPSKLNLTATEAADPSQHGDKRGAAGPAAEDTAQKNKQSPKGAAVASDPQNTIGASGPDGSTGVNASLVSPGANSFVAATLVSSDLGPVATAQLRPVANATEKASNAFGVESDIKANITVESLRKASASPITAKTVAEQAGAPPPAPAFNRSLETTDASLSATTPEGSGNLPSDGRVETLPAPVAAGVLAEVIAPQAGRVPVGGTPALRERRSTNTDGKTAERVASETAQSTTSPHFSGAVPDTARSSIAAHPVPLESATQSLAAGQAGLGGGGGVVPLSATQVVTHSVAAPAMNGIGVSGTVQGSSLSAGSMGLATPGFAGADSLVSPLAHTTLQATPTVLEVGVPGGTHGWLQIRAEIGEGGAVQASMSAATHEGQETLRRELPAMNAFLDSEHVPVSVQVAAHGVSGAVMSNVAGGSVAGGDTGFNLGSGLSQDAGSGRGEAQAGLLAGGDGARQGNGDGSQENSRATNVVTSGRAAASAEADWVSASNADPGSGYGTGISANGGSWLNVMA